jgi:hypothetical protein
MHILRTFSLLILAVVIVGCSTRVPHAGSRQPELPDIQAGYYRVDPYIQAAIGLQSLGRSNALAQLHSMAQDRKFETRVIVLCRMLFTQRPGSDFRRPMIGGASFFGGTDYADWPLEPIELVDGVPFLITRGYVIGGVPEPDEWYLRYCETNCDWSDFRYTTKNQAQKREALSKLLTSAKWRMLALDSQEQQFFSRQIE